MSDVHRTTGMASVCPCFSRRAHCSNSALAAIKITTLVVSLLLATIALMAILVASGALTETSTFYCLGKMGSVGASLLLIFSTITAGVVLVSLRKIFIEKCCRTQEARADSAEIDGDFNPNKQSDYQEPSPSTPQTKRKVFTQVTEKASDGSFKQTIVRISAKGPGPVPIFENPQE